MYFLLGIIFFAVFLITLAFLILARRRYDPSGRRLKEMESLANFQRGDQGKKSEQPEKGALNPTVEKVLSNFSKLSKKDEKSISKVRQKLIYAGYHKEDAIDIFTGSRIVTGLLFFMVFVYFGYIGHQPVPKVIMLSLLVGIVGYMIPDIILNSKIRKRQDEIASGLPYALDLLVISVEAGLGLNAAIQRVGHDMELRSEHLSFELLRVNQDIRTGNSREEALRNLSERNLIEDLRILVGALVLADKLGTSIADTLRAQADSLRTRIRQRAEKQAAQAGTKMLIPLVLFILPALILVLMGPGLIQVYRTFY
ncbi:type II secretion system F family protein [candidate division KSB1 bacterium]|nr:type II secretion system F family protein [candidate division KSB1 bacterium]